MSELSRWRSGVAGAAALLAALAFLPAAYASDLRGSADDAAFLRAARGVLWSDHVDLRGDGGWILRTSGLDEGAVIRVLIGALGSAKTSQAVEAAALLGEIGPDASASLPRLIDEVLYGKDADRRAACARALGFVGTVDGSAIVPLLSALRDPDPFVRFSGARALMRVGGRSALVRAALESARKDVDARVRLAAGGAAAAGAAAPPASAQGPSNRPAVILILGEGLGWGPLQLLHDELVLEGAPSALGDMLAEGRTAYCETTPLGNLVAESGAGSSALATGRKTENHRLSELADGERPATILELAHRAGWGTGLVSTGRITQAGPAAFLSHLRERDDEYEIARQFVDSGAEVMLGGGRGRFTPSELERAESEGYEVLFDARQLASLPPTSRGLLGLFADGDLPYAIDRDANRPGSFPKLADMEHLALTRLSRDDRSFVLVVDSRLIDEAAHYHDAAAVLAEMRETDHAARVALDYRRTHPGTLILVTSNHETGGYGMEYRANTANWGGGEQLRRIAEQTASLSSLLSEAHARAGAGGLPGAAQIREVVTPHLAGDVVLRPSDWAAVAAALTIGPKKRPFSYSPAVHALARALEPYYFASWGTGTHLSNPVPCFGVGPGSERLRGMLDDTELFQIMKSVLDEAAVTNSHANAAP